MSATARRGFDELAEALPALVFVTNDVEGNVHVNGRFQSYAGLSAPQLLGYRWLQILHPEDRARAEQAWSEALRTGSTYEAEYRFRRNDGTYRWFLCRAQPIGGTPREWYGTCVDIEERKQAEAQLARVRDELESRIDDRSRALTEAARQLAEEMRRREAAQAALLQTQKLEALGQLTSGVAHDFNNVLAGLAGAIALLERSGLGDTQRTYVQLARRGLERATRLVRQLVAFARSEPLAPRPVELRELLERSRELLAQAVGSRVAIDFDVPAEAIVLADPHQLEVALLNLAINARDAMPEGGRLMISTALVGRDHPEHPGGRAAAELVAIRVRDNGVGMTPEVLARATEAFFTTKPAGQGTGLGLPMVCRFARESGGEFSLRSESGRGTEAVLYLPPTSLRPEAFAAGDASIDRSRHGGATLLVVDDDEIVRRTTAGSLRDLGYTVLEAGDPLTAYALAHAAPTLDGIVTDVVMPTMDGPALVQRIRAEREVPALFVTGQAGRAKLFGEQVLEKPFSQAQLGLHLLRMLGREARALARGSRAEAEQAVQRIRNRLTDTSARECLDSWLALWTEGRLPDLRSLQRSGCAGRLYVAEFVAERNAFAFRELGEEVRDLLASLSDPAARATGPAAGAAPHQRVPIEIEPTLRRCLESRLPVYERLREIAAESQPEPLQFERLLLPVSASADGAATHVVGILQPPTAQASGSAAQRRE